MGIVKLHPTIDLFLSPLFNQGKTTIFKKGNRKALSNYFSLPYLSMIFERCLADNRIYEQACGWKNGALVQRANEIGFNYLILLSID